MSNMANDFKLESVEQVGQPKLVLLDDSPAGGDDPETVAFNHEIYAELLRDVLLANRAGVCVGFFARWGQGKSTVINLLGHALAGKAKLVIFNAYQARGDSVRRQMLLSVLRQIDPDKAKEYQRFSQTTTPLEFASAEEQARVSDRRILKLLFLEKKLDPFLIASACVAIGCAVLFGYHQLRVLLGYSSFADTHDLLLWLGGMVVACTAFIVRKFQERRTHLLAYTQPASDSQRLKYPEQFVDVFTEAVKAYSKTGNRLVVVVDDLDRCDPSTVVEALASVRQFCQWDKGSTLNCQFLVPCDEGQMVSALEADGYLITACHTRYHNYSEGEMLRKFFDFVVRMDEIVPESLADFAAEQAIKIGVSPDLARDVIDAAAIREPRKVKSLLNALRMAQEVVSRSQAKGSLPDPKQLERFDYTLAMLVTFQELAPIAFERIKEDADILLQSELPKEKGIEPVAHRFFSSFGPVSATTADVLITKQNEPSLRGLPQSHSLPAAVRADRGEDVVKILTEADEQERIRLLGWLIRKTLEARSSVRVRQLLSYILDFGKAKGWDTTPMRRFFSVLKKQSRFLPDALVLGNRMDTWGAYCNTLSSTDRLEFDLIVLENYVSNKTSDGGTAEEAFLFRFVDRLDPKIVARFRKSIHEHLYQGTDQVLNQNWLKRIAGNLPKDSNACFGFSPATGERLFQSLSNAKSNEVGKDYQAVCLQVGLCFIGSNSDSAQRVLTLALNRSPAFTTPQDLSESYLREHGVFFQLLHGILQGNSKLDNFLDFFRKYYWPWFAVQNHPHGRLKILSFIQPGLKFLPKEELEKIGQTVVPWLWSDEEVAREFVATISKPPHQDEAWMKGRDLIRTLVFTYFCNHARDQSSLSSSAKKFFLAAQVDAWKVEESAENLLAEKMRRLNPSIGGRPNDISEWFKALTPLCEPTLRKLAKTTRDSLANNNSPQELIQVALQTVWRNEIPDDCAPPLVDALIKCPTTTLGDERFGKILSAHPGFAEIARVLTNQIASRGADWLHSNKLFVMRLSEFVVTDEKLSAKFQERIDVLLTANRREYIETGLQLLAAHQRIIPDVKRSLEAWCKAQVETDELAKRGVEISHRPEL